MAVARQRLAARQLRTLYQLGAIGDLSDRQLLERFTTSEGELAELAFAALVERHGPMVLRVCAALLRNPHDAQDAFQATFLVLLRKAHAIWIRDSLGPWLHRVAKRLAVQVQASGRRRRAFECRAAESRGATVADKSGCDGGWTVLHEEIDRLPERYRIPVILCHLEGQSHELTAKALNLPVGTLKSRLHRARDILRGRLARRGAAFSAALLSAEMAASVVDAALSSRLTPSLLRAAARSGMTRAAERGLISLRTVHLVEEAIKTMFVTRMRIGVAVAILAGCFAVAAAGVYAQQGPGQDGAQIGSKRGGTSTGGRNQPTPAQPEAAPAYIRQSRKMIIERLEHELSAAQERLDRTTRKVASPSDPEAARARKTVETLANLIARIDTVLVEAVDQFPTAFDFADRKTDHDALADQSALEGALVYRPRQTTGDLKRDSDALKETLARAEIEVDQIEREVATIEANLNREQRSSRLLKESIKSGESQQADQVGGSDNKAKSELAHHQDLVNFHSEILKQKNEDLRAKRKNVQNLRELVDSLRKLRRADSNAQLDKSKTPLTAEPSQFDTNIKNPVELSQQSRAETQLAIQRGSDGKPQDASAGPPYDEHSLAKAAEKLQWSTRMLEKGYVSKSQHDRDRLLYESLKARIEADIARAQDRVDWARRMHEQGYVSKSQYDAEILKHYDALKARMEESAVSDAVLKRYGDLKSQYETKPNNPNRPNKPIAPAEKPAEDSRPEQ